MSAPAATSSSGVRVFTDPAVPTGMNDGVSTSPCAVERIPARADVVLSSASIRYEKLMLRETAAAARERRSSPARGRRGHE